MLSTLKLTLLKTPLWRVDTRHKPFWQCVFLKRNIHIKLVSTKLLNKWDIDLDLEEAEIEERNMVDYSECEDEYRTERAEAQEEYYRH